MLVKLSNVIPPALESYKIRQIVHLNTKQEYLTVCFDFCCVCLHRFSTIFDEFAIEITFDVAISTSEAMQFHAESLVIVKNRIWCFDFKLKQFFFKDFPTAKIYLTVCFDFLSVCTNHRQTGGVSWIFKSTKRHLRFFHRLVWKWTIWRILHDSNARDS